MSVKLSSYVWDGCAAAGIKGTRLLIMARLADFSNDEGISWPAIDTIARQIGAGRSTVIGAITQLENDGWVIRRQRKRGRGQNESNVYQLNVDKMHEATAHPPDSGEPELRPPELRRPESGCPKLGRLENEKNSELRRPESGHDPSLNSKQDPPIKKTVGQPLFAVDPQQAEKLKIDYLAVLEAYHTLLPEMPGVLEMTVDRRNKLRSLWQKFDFNPDKWVAYLRYIAKNCRWMLEDRPDTDTGKTWRRKNFDFLITEKCYLAVRETRANDLPKVARINHTGGDEAFGRLICQRRKPQNAVEEFALVTANRAGLGRKHEAVARAAWKSIWLQAQASDNERQEVMS